MIEITKEEAESLLDFIEVSFFDTIRNDEDVDNLEWVINIMSVYQKCKWGCEKECLLK